MTRNITDMENRLRASALNPPIREAHYDALLGELRSRRRSKRLHAYVASALSLMLVGMIMLQAPPLESTGFRFEYVEYLDSGEVVFRPYDDSVTSVTFVRSTGTYTPPTDASDDRDISDRLGERTIETIDAQEAAEMSKNFLTAQRLYMAGRMTLVEASGTTFEKQSSFMLEFEGVEDGKTYKYTEHICNGDYSERYLTWLNDGGFLEALVMEYEGRLGLIEPDTLELLGNTISFKRSTLDDPEYGEIVMWSSETIN